MQLLIVVTKNMPPDTVPDMERNPVVYILASQNRRALYIGVTTNLSRRLEEHRQGMVHHTARYNISRLIYVESHEIAP
ncbi:MAG: GIY-YIG nuclease family protein, partial [Reyranella sp.]